MGYKDWQGFHKPEINQTNLIRTSITGLDWKTTGMNFSREAAWISINWFRILQYTSTKLRTNLIFTVSGLLNNLILNQLFASGQPPKKRVGIGSGTVSGVRIRESGSVPNQNVTYTTVIGRQSKIRRFRICLLFVFRNYRI
jgi:hypothetical protein